MKVFLCTFRTLPYNADLYNDNMKLSTPWFDPILQPAILYHSKDSETHLSTEQLQRICAKSICRTGIIICDFGELGVKIFSLSHAVSSLADESGARCGHALSLVVSCLENNLPIS